MRQLRFLLPSFAVALVIGANDARASLLRELEEAIALVEAREVEARKVEGGEVEVGDVQDVTLTKRFVEVTVRIPVKGAKERKQVRYAHWRLLLEGDRRDVFQHEGWPTYRTQEDFAGSVTERWTYADRHVTYVFQGDRLVDTQRF